MAERTTLKSQQDTDEVLDKKDTDELLAPSTTSSADNDQDDDDKVGSRRLDIMNCWLDSRVAEWACHFYVFKPTGHG